MEKNLKALGIKCKKLMVELEFDGMGSRPFLASEISTPEDQVNPNSLTMALTGYRKSARSEYILNRLRLYLENRRLEGLYNSGGNEDGLQKRMET
jgi:hypothetical protein